MKKANFGYEARKSLYCATHKHNDMIDVIHKKCAATGCDTLPYFGYTGGSADYCSQHKLLGSRAQKTSFAWRVAD